jgi:hypothetical protein
MKYTWIWMFMAALLLPPAATAEDAFPSKPIKVIVPFTPGAGSDIAAGPVGGIGLAAGVIWDRVRGKKGEEGGAGS